MEHIKRSSLRDSAFSFHAVSVHESSEVQSNITVAYLLVVSEKSVNVKEPERYN